MGLLRPQNVIEESWPSFCVTRIIGLRPLILRKTKSIGYLYILVLWILYYAMVYLTMDYANEIYTEWLIISKSMRIRHVEFIINIVSCTLMVGCCLFNSSRVENSNSLLNKFDAKLKLLNVKFNYKIFMKIELVHFIGIGLFTVLMALIEYTNLQSASRTNFYILMSITNQLPHFVNSFAIVPFVIMCLKVSKRNEVINDLIPTMTNSPNNLPGSLSIDMNNVFRVKLLREGYGLMVGVVAAVNDTYVSFLLISFTIFVMGIFIHLDLAYSAFRERNQLADVIVESVWMIFFMCKCIYIINACHSVNYQMESFARQVENTNITFTVYSLFVIDYVILLKVILTMTAYILYLSQFEVGSAK